MCTGGWYRRVPQERHTGSQRSINCATPRPILQAWLELETPPTEGVRTLKQVISLVISATFGRKRNAVKEANNWGGLRKVRMRLFSRILVMVAALLCCAILKVRPETSGRIAEFSEHEAD